jgi:dihydroorotase
MMAKGVAKILDLPLYLHIGDIYEQGLPTYMAQVLDLLETGDIVTHCLTGEPSNLLDENGGVLPQALSARDRGVMFDVGFGSFSVDFTVAERLFEAGLVPDTISSDLQQVNVTGPAFSLTTVMSAMMSLGLSLKDVVDKVTSSAARALHLDKEIGSLTAGGVADVTVFDVQSGDFVYADTSGHTRPGSTRLAPYLTIKRGSLFPADPSKAEQEANWNFKRGIARAEPPAQSQHLDSGQRAFLRALRQRLTGIDTWEGLPLSKAFHEVRRQQGLDVGPAAAAVLDSFFETRFSPPVGWLLWELGQDFVLNRLAEVSSPGRQAHQELD